MKTIVISYSLTGNNNALAAGIAGEFAADHIKITEPKPRTTGTIVFDMIFNRTPKITMPPLEKEYDLKLFVGPVWMGKVASPFRACFKQLGSSIGDYAFLSICGGALGPNPKLAEDLKKRLAKEPVSVIDLPVADLLPKGLKSTMKVTSAYRIKEKDVKILTDAMGKTLREILAK